MDWAKAITRNSEALKGIIEALFAMLGLAGDVTVGRIPRPLHTAALRILRPAESAVRRLIIIAATACDERQEQKEPLHRCDLLPAALITCSAGMGVLTRDVSRGTCARRPAAL